MKTDKTLPKSKAIILIISGIVVFFLSFLLSMLSFLLSMTLSPLVIFTFILSGVLFIMGVKKLKDINDYNNEILSASKLTRYSRSKNLSDEDSDDTEIYNNIEGAQKILNIYKDHIELTQIKNARAAISGNWTQGSKVIYYSDMTSVQYREATNALLGYIQFEVPGIGTSSNFNSENSWTFDITTNDLAQEIVDYVKSRIREYKEISRTGFNSLKNNQFSTADEIKKFKELLDSGIITQEEFDAKKKQLLGL